MMTEAVQRAVQHTGALINNYEVVESLRGGLVGGLRAESMVPSILEEILDEEAWLDRMDINGRRFTFDRADPRAFRRFIEGPAPEGLETTPDAIRKFLGDSTNPLRQRFESLIRSDPGNPRVTPETPRDSGGKFALPVQADEPDRIPNTIRDSVDQEYPIDSMEGGSVLPDVPTLPLPPPRARDRSREPKAGDSVGYAVRRLEREAAKDPEVAAIYDRLKAGDITAHRAMILAGFKEELIPVPPDPERAGRILARHFDPDQLDRLIAAYRAAREDLAP